MNKEWFARILQVTVVALTVAAVCQELEKPKEKRRWQGMVAGFVPYDFRLPTVERLKEAYWNPCDSRIFTPEVFGIGWAMNFYTLMERLGLIREIASEEDFLMPTQSIKDMIE